MTQLTLRCLKYIKGIFNPYAVWHSYFLIPRQSFQGKRAKSLERIFPSSKNAIWSILLKYQEIDMQIHSLTKIETSYVVALLNGTNRRFYRLQILKMWTLYAFILVQLWKIICQCPKRFVNFEIRSKHFYNIVKI